MSWILTIVNEKPTQFTIVNAVPLVFGSAYEATNVEKRGESGMIVIPHSIKKAMKAGVLA